MPVSHRIAIVLAAGVLSDAYSWRRERLAIVDAATGRHLPTLTYDPVGPHCVAWSSDGQRLVVGRNAPWAYDLPLFSVYDASSLAEEPGWGAVPLNVNARRVSASATHVAVGTVTKNLSVYDFATKALVHSAVLTGDIYALAWSPDGARLAVGTSQEFRVYDTATWSTISGVTSRSWAFAAAFSPDGQYLAVGHGGGSATQLDLYDTATWTSIPTGVQVAFPAAAQSVSWRGDSGAVCLGVTKPPHAVVVTVPGLVPLTVSAPAGTAQGEDAHVRMLPDGRLAISRSPGVGHSLVSLLAPDLATIEQDLYPTGRTPMSIAVSPWLRNDISGRVLDEASQPAQGRRVLCVHDASELVVASAVTAADGTYKLTSPHADGHTVVLIEDDGRAQALGSGILPL